MPPEDGTWNIDPAVHPTPDAIPEPKTEDDPTIQEDNPDPNVQQPLLHMEDDPLKKPRANSGREVVQMCPNCRMEWDVEAAPELCTECPNAEPITVEWLAESQAHEGQSWSGPDPKRGGGGALQTPKWSHGPVCFGSG